LLWLYGLEKFPGLSRNGPHLRDPGYLYALSVRAVVGIGPGMGGGGGDGTPIQKDTGVLVGNP